MNPQESLYPPELFCPNPDCPSRGQNGQGNIVVHSRKERRLRCKVCGKTFAQTKQTALYRLHKPSDLFVLVTTLLAYGCPLAAIVAAFGLDERTVAAWQKRAGEQARRVHEHLVLARPLDLGQVQADEIRVKTQRRQVQEPASKEQASQEQEPARQGRRGKPANVLWMALALCVPFRLWLGGCVSPHRDRRLIGRLAQRVRGCALPRPLLVCFDGLKCYVGCFRRAFRWPQRTGGPGRPRLVSWPDLCLGQVVKLYDRGHVTGVLQRLVQGSKEPLAVLLAGANVINTAHIERLNATFRARLWVLVRRSRCLCRQQATLEAGMYLVGCVYNFCTPHRSLEGRAPAQAAGITDRCWSMAELLSFRVPPPRWQPPKQRGRRSKAMQALVERWAA